LIYYLKQYKDREETFYEVRKQNWLEMPAVEAAARTIYLNRTCYNGLYRVNKTGQFNVPYGRYRNPRICDAEALRKASTLLQNAHIVLGDYKDILSRFASDGDFIFLDPPYLPISQYSDFKRYTKEQFREEHHIELAAEVHRLHDIGCNILLTNSNHPLVHQLYSEFPIVIVPSKRIINNQGMNRSSEDTIVTIPSHYRSKVKSTRIVHPDQSRKFPSTRYMGSKAKILPHIMEVIRKFDCENVLDLFSGSGVVAYAMKADGHRVFANDYMAMSAINTKALIENNNTRITEEDLIRLAEPNPGCDLFVSQTFDGLYFEKEDNLLIDQIRANIKLVDDPYKQALAMAGLMRACIKKRPRGIFTYVGYRYDDGRSDLRISLMDHFFAAVRLFNEAVFDNGQQNETRRGDAMSTLWEPDLVYMDPPYYSLLSDNEYVRRYHFVEGLACDWQGVDMQWHTKTKKFKSYPTPFSSRIGATDAFDRLFHRFKDSIQVISYSSNSLPTRDEILAMMSKYKKHVDVIAIDHRYCIGTHGHKVNDNNNLVDEYLFVGY